MDLFGTAGVRGSVAETVTPERAMRVARAAAADGTAFVVARDGRVTGSALAAAVEAGLESGGATVHRAGRLPTPALAFASQGRRGVMVTASHNPPADNGLKFFADGREYNRDAERRLESRVEAGPETVAWDAYGDAADIDPISAYREAVSDYARAAIGEATGRSDSHPATADLTVAVDCGNGMAGLATPQVLRALGVDVLALNANVDGHFPGRGSKPTAETLTDLRAFVADGEAALGIGHDGDADRIVLVDADGTVVHEDTILAILAEHFVGRSDAADPVVVTTPNASGRIDERVEVTGGRVERVHLGALHEGVDAARSAGGPETAVAFAAEPWKHVHPGLGGWIDGVASAAVLSLLAARRGLSALRDPVTERPYRKENVRCPDAAKAAAMADLEESLPDAFPAASVATEHGVRLTLPDAAWTLVRPSGTEPYLRIYAEADDVDDLVADVRREVERAVESAEGG